MKAIHQTLAVMALVGLAATSAEAADGQDGALCNPVIDGGGYAVRTSGGILRSIATHSCPQEAKAEPVDVVEELVVVEPEAVSIESDGLITFDFDKSIIKPEFYPELNVIAEIAKDAADSEIAVVGHTDSVGTEAYNQGLSERRAQAVADYLTKAGVEPGKLVVRGDGETDPVASNETEAGRAENRRAEVLGLALE